MWLRRAVYYSQLGAAIVLPLWLLIGRGLIVGGPGWEFVLLLFISPILFLYMLLISGLTFARKTVRIGRAVSWVDVAVHGAWFISLIAAGAFASTATAVLAVVLGIVAFWSAIWQLVSETRRRVQTVIAGLDYTVIPAGEYQATRQAPDAAGFGQVIRIDPPRESSGF